MSRLDLRIRGAHGLLLQPPPDASRVVHVETRQGGDLLPRGHLLHANGTIPQLLRLLRRDRPRGQRSNQGVLGAVVDAFIQLLEQLVVLRAKVALLERDPQPCVVRATSTPPTSPGRWGRRSLHRRQRRVCLRIEEGRGQRSAASAALAAAAAAVAALARGVGEAPPAAGTGPQAAGRTPPVASGTSGQSCPSTPPARERTSSPESAPSSRSVAGVVGVLQPARHSGCRPTGPRLPRSAPEACGHLTPRAAAFAPCAPETPCAPPTRLADPPNR
eukprot:scaffold797_cov236-Pinguiococcus_pyrenoidosus.AAC.12